MRNSAGRDWQSTVLGNSQAAGAGTGIAAPAQYLGLTANAVAPADGNTTLTGEIVTTGLTRKLATYAHTPGSSAYTLTATYTAVAGDVPVTVAKLGVFNALAGGTMPFESLLNAVATLSAAGDQVTCTETVNI